jgi:FAD:protein FMN transferase
MAFCSIQREHPAMATRWRCWLAGTDEQHLHAVADWWAEEITRWDRMLSKFDPASEVRRLNRAPAGQPRKVHHELFELLRFCELAWSKTSGLFDVTATSPSSNPIWNQNSFRVNPLEGTFVWDHPNRQLDFGGIAKGYVLDQLAPALQQHGVTAAMLDAGGSSLLTWDTAGDITSWLVSISAIDDDTNGRSWVSQNPSDWRDSRPMVELNNMGLSYSATRDTGTTSGQTIDPRSGKDLADCRACVVISKSAAWAEVLSTAALCMGEAAAAEYIIEGSPVECRLGWLEDNIVRWHNSAAAIEDGISGRANLG